MLREISGSFQVGETVSGRDSRAASLIRSVSRVSAGNCVVADNWVAREDGRAPVDRVKLDRGCTANHIGRNHYMSANGLVGVDFTDDPGSVVSDRSVTTGSGPPTGGRWPKGAFRFNSRPSFLETIILGKDVIRNGDLEPVSYTHLRAHET